MAAQVVNTVLAEITLQYDLQTSFEIHADSSSASHLHVGFTATKADVQLGVVSSGQQQQSERDVSRIAEAQGRTLKIFRTIIFPLAGPPVAMEPTRETIDNLTRVCNMGRIDAIRAGLNAIDVVRKVEAIQ